MAPSVTVKLLEKAGEAAYWGSCSSIYAKDGALRCLQNDALRSLFSLVAVQELFIIDADQDSAVAEAPRVRRHRGDASGEEAAHEALWPAHTPDPLRKGARGSAHLGKLWDRQYRGRKGFSLISFILFFR